MTRRFPYSPWRPATVAPRKVSRSAGRARWVGLFGATSLLVGACASVSGRPPAAGPAAPVADAVARATYDSLRATLDRAVADGAFPGAYAAVGTADGIIAEYGAGQLDAADPRRPDARTVWDLASLTKVIGTTSALLQLVGDGRVGLDTPVVRYLPEWRATGADRVTVRHLLTHTSGLPAWRALYKEAATPTEAAQQVFATAPDTLPGVRTVYSDLGFILLGKLVERVSGEALDQYDSARIFAPLGMADTRYLPPAAWRARTAPTEKDPWRQRHLRGEVHDENASRLGGVSGHAGLFSTGRDLARFARLYLNFGQLDGVRVFDSATVAAFIVPQDTTLSRRGLGWETATGGNSAGRRLSRAAFGHTGFTGTSLWMDPQRGVFVLLLTNRVNPTRENRKIGAVRTAVADAAVGALEGQSRTESR